MTVVEITRHGHRDLRISVISVSKVKLSEGLNPPQRRSPEGPARWWITRISRSALDVVKDCGSSFPNSEPALISISFWLMVE